MIKYNINVIGFGDNVVDKYENTKIMYPGGNSLNFAVYAKFLGVKKSAYMGYFGNDKEAKHVIDTLSELEVETSNCKQLEGENGCARVTIENGERIFLGSNNGGVRGKIPFILSNDNLEYLKSFDLLHTGNYSFTENELNKIRALNVPISFDFSDDSTIEYYEKVTPNINYAFCSFDGTEDEIKEHLKKIVNLGAELACASRGKKGCILFDGEKYFIQEAILLDRIEDTMGAGDSLITAFLINYLTKIKAGIEKEIAIMESLNEAANFAAKTCMLKGSFGYGEKY